jgi:hypothetical protein
MMSTSGLRVMSSSRPMLDSSSSKAGPPSTPSTARRITRRVTRCMARSARTGPAPAQSLAVASASACMASKNWRMRSPFSGGSSARR